MKQINETHFKEIKKRQAISYAQSMLRYDFQTAIAKFNEKLDQLNLDMTADVQISISYKRRKD